MDDQFIREHIEGNMPKTFCGITLLLSLLYKKT